MNLNDSQHLSSSPTTADPARSDAAWLEAHWMPYTGNRQYKQAPRMMASASGAYFTDT